MTNIELAEQLAEFAERGNQQRVYLNSGQMLQGWIMEISEDALLLSTGFNEKSGQDHWLNFTDIDLSCLQFWSVKEQRWIHWVMPG